MACLLIFTNCLHRRTRSRTPPPPAHLLVQLQNLMPSIKIAWLPTRLQMMDIPDLTLLAGRCLKMAYPRPKLFAV